MSARAQGLADALHNADARGRLSAFATATGSTAAELSSDGIHICLHRVCDAMRARGYVVHGPVTPTIQPRPGLTMQVVAIEKPDVAFTLTIFLPKARK